MTALAITFRPRLGCLHPSSFRCWVAFPVVGIVAKRVKERQAMKRRGSMQKCFNVETLLWSEIIT